MKDNERFLYEIRPIRPIKDLIPDKKLMKVCSMHLTKDEVYKCLSNATIWRKFPGRSPIKVTGENLDRLHRKNLVDPEEYIPTADKNFFRDNIKKVMFNPFTGEWYFVDKSGPNKEFTAKYKHIIHITTDFAFVDGIRGFKIPVEVIHDSIPDNKNREPEEEKNSADDKKDFLSEKEEEYSAPTYNNSSSKNNRKNKNNRVRTK